MHMLSSGSHLKMTLFITSNQIDWLCTVKKNQKIFALKNISGIEILIRTELFPEIVDECSFLFLSSTAQNCCPYLLKDVSFGEYTWALIVHFPSWKPLRFKVKAPEVFSS